MAPSCLPAALGGTISPVMKQSFLCVGGRTQRSAPMSSSQPHAAAARASPLQALRQLLAGEVHLIRHQQARRGGATAHGPHGARQNLRPEKECRICAPEGIPWVRACCCPQPSQHAHPAAGHTGRSATLTGPWWYDAAWHGMAWRTSSDEQPCISSMLSASRWRTLPLSPLNSFLRAARKAQDETGRQKGAQRHHRWRHMASSRGRASVGKP